MRKVLSCVVFICVLAVGFVVAQVRIAPKKVIYRRPKPISQYKKSFTIIWPKVTGRSASVARKIENALNYEKLFDFTIKEEQTDMQWLEEASYEVLFNKHNILCVGLSIQGTAAYPSGSDRYVVLDSRNGSVAGPSSVFIDSEKLAELVNKRMQKAIAEEVARWKTDPDLKDLDEKELLGVKVFQEANLDNFSLNTEGVTFRYEFGFPHAILGAEPDSEFLFTWAEMKPFINPRGLLAVLVR
ncbi:MAG: hypothetical protein K1X52_02260 [Pyrinomonadaceae bacterium]|nr:hypothetical protein [Pyrinomonadaceae bacterium]